MIYDRKTFILDPIRIKKEENYFGQKNNFIEKHQIPKKWVFLEKNMKTY